LVLFGGGKGKSDRSEIESQLSGSIIPNLLSNIKTNLTTMLNSKTDDLIKKVADALSSIKNDKTKALDDLREQKKLTEVQYNETILMLQTDLKVVEVLDEQFTKQ